MREIQAHVGGILAAHEGCPQAEVQAVGPNLLAEFFKMREPLCRVLELAVFPFPLIIDNEHPRLSCPKPSTRYRRN